MKRIVSFLAVLTLLLGLTATVSAAESPRPPLDEGALGELQVDLYFGSDSCKEPLPDVEIGVVRVASVTSEKGGAHYTSLSPFDQVSISWPDLSAAQSEEIAGKMEELVKVQSVSFQKAVTSSNGRVVFGNLEPGMYLVYQTKKAAVNTRFQEMEPFLTAVPELENGEWKYQVKVLPKTSIIQQKPYPSKPPQTDVNTHQHRFEVLFFASMFFMLILLPAEWRMSKNR